MDKKKSMIEFIIDEVGFPNKGTATLDGDKVKFKGGIKGQRVSARISRRRKGTIEVKLNEILEKSPLETEIGCPHYGVCGGCTYQTLLYEKEIEYKLNQVQRLFDSEDIGIEIEDIEQSPIVNGYRNKMEYTFGDEVKDGPLALGMHMKGRFYEVVNVDACNIVNNDFTIIRETARGYFEGKGTPHFNKRSHKGVLRHLVIRKSMSTGEILINIVTTSQEEWDREGFVKTLTDIGNLNGKIVGILHTTNDGLGDIVKADRLDILYGKDYITEEVLGLKFKVSPFSFFQTNTLGAEKLYSIAREFAGDIDDKVVFDLYSGTGTIAQIMAPVAQKVIGIEIVEEAVEMARENARLNNLDNVEFIAGDVLQAVDNLTERPDLIVIDPPRDGIHPKAINKIIDFDPETFVYVSCNPVTLVRDLKVFKERGYEIKRAKLMDMFPRTPHVEAAILMTYCGLDKE